MADIPRDPRQLARDILAGKISIEDLAREQARRAGRAPGSPGAPMPQKLPDRIPLPRPAPPPPQRKPVHPPPQSRKAPPKKPARPPVNVPPPARQPLAPAGPTVQPPDLSVPTARRESRPTDMQAALRTRGSLRQAILMAEILNKPVALRDE